MTTSDLTEEIEDEAQGRASDALFRVFEQRIYSGDLKVGDPLPPEREIVRVYGVSRTVVREALSSLSNKGLIAAKPRCRPVVAAPTFTTALKTVDALVARLLTEEDGVRNLFETRIMVEVALVREAAKTRSDQDLKELKAALDANTAAIKDSEEFYDTDRAYHGVIYGIPGNPVLSALHLAYTTWLSKQWLRMPRLPERNAINNAAHRAIYEAILDRDADRAEAAVRAHLDDAWDQVRATFEKH